MSDEAIPKTSFKIKIWPARIPFALDCCSNREVWEIQFGSAMSLQWIWTWHIPIREDIDIESGLKITQQSCSPEGVLGLQGGTPIDEWSWTLCSRLYRACRRSSVQGFSNSSTVRSSMCTYRHEQIPTDSTSYPDPHPPFGKHLAPHAAHRSPHPISLPHLRRWTA